MRKGTCFVRDAIRRLFDRNCRKIKVSATLHGMPIARQKMRICGNGVVRVGKNVSFGWKRSPDWSSTEAYIDARRLGSCIEIGEGCTFSNGAALISESEGKAPGIAIGRACVIGSRFRCYDSDFHGVAAHERDTPRSVKMAAVSIGSECFIGENVIVLKGVSLGDRCVVGAGSVVTHSFPADSVIAGNPARLVKKIVLTEV